MTCFGRDKWHRPILLGQPLKINDLPFKPDQDTLVRSLLFIMMYIKKNLFYKGRVENFIVVIDLAHLGPT